MSWSVRRPELGIHELLLRYTAEQKFSFREKDPMIIEDPRLIDEDIDEDQVTESQAPHSANKVFVAFPIDESAKEREWERRDQEATGERTYCAVTSYRN